MAGEQIKWAIFDLDDTVYDYNHSNEKWSEAVVSYTEKMLNQETTNKQKDIADVFHSTDGKHGFVEKPKAISRKDIKEAISLGRKETNEAMPHQWAWHSRLLYFQKAIEKLTGRTHFELTLEMEKVFWDAFVEHMEVYDGALDILKKLKQSNRKVTILTDLTAQIQHKKIIKLLWWNQHYVDYLVSSEEVWVEKPDPAWFRLSLQKMILNADEVCMIGDNYKKDILWAKKAWITKLYHKINGEKWKEYQDDTEVTHFQFFSEIEGDF